MWAYLSARGKRRWRLRHGVGGLIQVKGESKVIDGRGRECKVRLKAKKACVFCVRGERASEQGGGGGVKEQGKSGLGGVKK